MNIEVAVLCDAATDSGGKLNILGAFDTVFAGGVPFKHQHMALALRIRFSAEEAGEHPVRIHFMDADGQKVIPPIDGKINIQFGPQARTAVGNLIIHLNQVEFRADGEYAIDIAIDGTQVHSLPFFVRVRQPRKPS